MTNAVRILRPGQERSTKKIYHRQKNEPAHWFQRFQRYMLMGRERSLIAVWQQEKEADKGDETILQNLDVSLFPPASIPSLPGNWSRTSKVWHWVERAKEYDADRLRDWQEDVIQKLATECKFVQKEYRILTLDALAEALFEIGTKTNSEAPGKPLALRDKLFCFKLLRDVLGDIAREMEQV